MESMFLFIWLIYFFFVSFCPFARFASAVGMSSSSLDPDGRDKKREMDCQEGMAGRRSLGAWRNDTLNNFTFTINSRSFFIFVFLFVFHFLSFLFSFFSLSFLFLGRSSAHGRKHGSQMHSLCSLYSLCSLRSFLVSCPCTPSFGLDSDHPRQSKTRHFLPSTL